MNSNSNRNRNSSNHNRTKERQSVATSSDDQDLNAVLKSEEAQIIVQHNVILHHVCIYIYRERETHTHTYTYIDTHLLAKVEQHACYSDL